MIKKYLSQSWLLVHKEKTLGKLIASYPNVAKVAKNIFACLLDMYGDDDSLL